MLTYRRTDYETIRSFIILKWQFSFLHENKALPRVVYYYVCCVFTCSIQNIMRGSTNTRVFPDPVKAIPIISRPDNLHVCIQHSKLHTGTYIHTLLGFLGFVLEWGE